MRMAILLCCLIGCTPTEPAQDEQVVELNGIRLYLPDNALQQRIGDDATQLSEYIKALQNETAAFWRTAGRSKAKGLLLAVGVKPGKKAKMWCEALDGEIPVDVLSSLEIVLEKVPTVDVKGAIAFAVELRLWGQNPDKFPDMPKAWVDAATTSKVPLDVPDGLFAVIWPK